MAHVVVEKRAGALSKNIPQVGDLEGHRADSRGGYGERSRSYLLTTRTNREEYTVTLQLYMLIPAGKAAFKITIFAAGVQIWLYKPSLHQFVFGTFQCTY